MLTDRSWQVVVNAKLCRCSAVGVNKGLTLGQKNITFAKLLFPSTHLVSPCGLLLLVQCYGLYLNCNTENFITIP